ncbi:hypothetical protein GUJ93_ZPchr0013g34606 [Zizania palustris]|uniref:AUGMIN subunit 3 n=1 Tax=Zizania palustris TaxID=103762 RepID=A0A8J6C282_ZIZPA|nr:hypothetical protein GUJ93_ZPchr0013g34606 [Zizania palustris]
MQQWRPSCGRLERDDGGGVLKGLACRRALKTWWICSDADGLGKAKSGGRKGTLDGLVDDINRAAVASTTPLTVQIDERLGVADNGVRNLDSDGRTDKVGGAPRCVLVASSFAKSKRQHIEAQVEYAKEEAILSTLRIQLASQPSHVHQDIHFLRTRNSELAEELMDLSLQVQKCLSETITSLCADLAQFEGANVLQGDHNLKVVRQEYYISQQKRFINHLVNQLAAHQFLKIACWLERQAKISSAYSLLKAIEIELQSYLSVVYGRLDRYHLIDQAALEMLEEGSVDDRDTFLHAVRDILSSHSGAQARTPSYVSAYGLVEQMTELQDELHYLHHELENVLPRERKRCIDEICRMIQSLEQILAVPLTYVQPTLTPWPLGQALEELEIINQQVSACVNEVTTARDEKAEMLQKPSRNVQQERRVFVDFFCHPGRLENLVREMSSHIRALPEKF